ncbi:hypothetical protein F5B22DRAFT_645817 [Xylaria bambusicola]|uniref:uncharacterized protein n=1 Tax=Xylaria bambusicola TaxID=326684 RepID=UPI002008D022|nr:uncharacterized protein F5B22DRAFT_645817 [Xylaria bambusicola]KAI0517637.1 hypothetical protein F5B22DRAFT_645817 [Xylaria bambusicola]
MNATPTFSRFNFHSEEDLSFGMFGVSAATNHTGFHESLEPTPYADAFPLHTQPPHSGSLSTPQTPFELLPRTIVASPYHLPSKFESPALSTGSSSTPETNESQHLVTPENAPNIAIGQALDSEAEMEDLDDDPPPLLSSARRMPGKPKAKENSNPKETEGKRKHFLQRNRVAAMKCRKKKKEWVNDLEETKSGLENQNAHLHMELDGLVDEASRIRAQLMAHANCNDSNIDKWIENEAKRFVIGTGERYDQILAHFSPTQGINGHQDGMPSSSATGSEYAAGGPSLISPLATPSQVPHNLGQVTSPPTFFNQNRPSISTPGCYPIPSQDHLAQGFDQTPGVDDEPDYDGMSISLYDHPVS